MSMIIDPYRFAPVGAPSALQTYQIIGVEHEASPAERWSTAGGGTAPSSIQSGITDAHGRVYFTSGTRGRHDLGANYSNLTLRMRFRPTINTGTDEILEMRDTSASPQCTIQLVAADGSFRVIRGASNVLETSDPGLWSINNWFYIEFQAVIDNSGSWLVRLWNDSGTLLDTLSGSGDTQETANAFANFVSFGSSTTDTYIDDISVDLGGAIIGARSIVIVRYPTGAGNYSAWTRGGTDTGANFSQINETVKDTVSYNQSTAADQKDSYAISLASLGGTMRALQVNGIARAATAGSRQFKVFLRIGGVDYEGAKTFTATSTSADTNFWEVWDNNPATGNEWTGSETVEIGVKSVTTDLRLHHCCAEILVSL